MNEGENAVMIDIHMHVIPVVDDGARSLKESLEMLRIAAAQGITAVVATSHGEAFDRGYSELVRRRFDELVKAAGEEIPSMQLYFGAEIFCSRYIIEKDISKLQRGVYPALNETKYVLSEFSPWEAEEDAVYCLRRLQEAGYYPVMAHAERCDFVNERSARRLREMGILMQINIYSVREERSDRIRERANMLLSSRYVDFTGSDAHRMNHRSPSVSVGIKYLYENYDRDYVDLILSGNAIEKILR